MQIPKSAIQAKHTIIPFIWRYYGSGDDWDVFVKDGRDVMIRDDSGEHFLISEYELSEGWAQIVMGRLAKIVRAHGEKEMDRQ